MPLAGLVVNRASPAPIGRPVRRRGDGGRGAAARRTTRAASPRACCGCTPTGPGWSSARRGCGERFAAAHPQVPTAVVPALAGDVHDLDGLRRVGALLRRAA